MRLYERWILPWLTDLAMRNRALSRYRGRVVPPAQGNVLEIGVGAGLNLPRYGNAVTHICALDPSAALLRLAAARRDAAPCPVALLRGIAEQLPFRDGSFDTVVMTWTLCSIPDPLLALREMRRVLRPGGRLLFVEHGLAPEPNVARWQHLLTPGWKRIAGGCHLDRPAEALIRDAGFRLEALDTGYMRGPKPWTFMYEGVATR
ncbi:MAG: class I SAM-dependent methyltransferase [Thiohalocapsa sp.]